MLLVIVDCSTSFSQSISASPILKFVGLGPSAQPSGVTGNGGYAVTSGGGGGGGGGLLTTLPRRSTELRRQLAW